jgi:hypothetical protein
MGIYLISIWLLIGAIALILTHRMMRTMRRATPVEALSVGLFLIGVVSGIASVVARDPLSSAFVWVTLGFVNCSLATAGWEGSLRVLAALGFFGTVAALVLIAVHSFSSLPVVVAAGVLCLGAALLARSTEETIPLGQR